MRGIESSGEVKNRRFFFCEEEDEENGFILDINIPLDIYSIVYKHGGISMVTSAIFFSSEDACLLAFFGIDVKNKKINKYLEKEEKRRKKYVQFLRVSIIVYFL